MFTQLAGKASFVNHLPKLTQATSDDGEPTSAYLLDEITKISYESMLSSHQLVDYLLHRLNKSPTPVKIKVLKMIIYVINNGHISFRQQLRQNDGPIKSAVLHSGPADPLLGLTLYKDVQKLAQETLDFLFNPETMKGEEEDGPSLTSMESPPVFMGGMGAVARGGGKYEGFGNAVKEREGTVTDKMLDYLGRLIHPSDNQTSEVIRAALHSSPGDYQPVAVAGTLIDPVFTSEIPAPKTNFIKNHVPGRAGGGWESDEDDCIEDVANQSSSETLPPDLHNTINSGMQQQEEGASKPTIQFETEQVLKEFMDRSGLPSIDELDEAFSKCAIAGLPNISPALSKMVLDLSTTSHVEGLMRIMLLLEWLYYQDSVVQQVISKDVAEILDKIVKDHDMPAPCRSKAKKLKFLYASGLST